MQYTFKPAKQFPPMAQTTQNQVPRVIHARARVWSRGRQWVLSIADESVRQQLAPYVGRRIVVEVLPLVYIEATLRNDMGYPAVYLPSCLRRTWQALWGTRYARRMDLLVRIVIEDNQETERGGV